jgi:hypothetical protein
MKANFEVDDQKQSIKIAAGIVVVLLFAAFVGYVFFVPIITEFTNEFLDPGVGVKTAAIISFSVTFVTLVVFAVFAGDGIIGEIQFMIGGFFAFFVIFWFLIAWIF